MYCTFNKIWIKADSQHEIIDKKILKKVGKKTIFTSAKCWQK
jgi:hypothetical protein